MKHQLTGNVRRVHAEQLTLAELSEWPEEQLTGSRIRQTQYVVPPQETRSPNLTVTVKPQSFMTSHHNTHLTYRK